MSEEDQAASIRRILASSSVLGGAQIVNIIAGILRLKAAAIIVGPAGVGLIGFYMNLVQTASSLAAVGIETVGTRQIAAANADGETVEITHTRRSLFRLAGILGLVGSFAVWAARAPIAELVFDDPSRSDDVGWLALGVGFGVAVAAQTAVLTGLRRVGYLAGMRAGAGILGAFLGVAALLLWGEGGLLAMVLAGPVALVLCGTFFIRRLPKHDAAPEPIADALSRWRTLLHLGIPVMLSGIVTLLGHLAARGILQRELGDEALGFFQAAWAIGMTYLGVVLAAMSSDYYPRLTAAVADRPNAIRIVNQQTETALLLCGPPLVVLLGTAPWVIELLYSSDFAPAADVLRWQLLGDVFKVLSWPLGFVLLAMGAGRAFIFTQSLWVVVFLAFIVFGIPRLGIAASGVAFIAAYATLLVVNFAMIARRLGVVWTRTIWAETVVLFAAAAVLALGGCLTPLETAIAGLVLGSVIGILALARLADLGEARGRLAPLARFARKLMRFSGPRS